MEFDSRLEIRCRPEYYVILTRLQTNEIGIPKLEHTGCWSPRTWTLLASNMMELNLIVPLLAASIAARKSNASFILSE